ncbi:hypothetical protein CCM_03538 [Cordyceps militaris CM01]|uniref:Uncharacterized protein n=1 Tax=Cordyceps militaris (strain CM01) TaxID=983644 RepID=G3JBA8_CORMM|nr:uncharacterized protein CCM_03538 [Cordyceps militaris CM01]EGX95266.1 hypothetical protein CCM_03538 [Cordyceps militaris CM01]
MQSASAVSCLVTTTRGLVTEAAPRGAKSPGQALLGIHHQTIILGCSCPALALCAPDTYDSGISRFVSRSHDRRKSRLMVAYLSDSGQSPHAKLSSFVPLS